MRPRRDGLETRTHLLAAATEVFSEKGYSDASVAEICERAEANVASVSYYFGSKEGLYAEVWRQLADEMQELYPPDGRVAASASFEARLEAHVSAMLKRMTHRGPSGCMYRLHEHERTNPTGLADEVIRGMMEPSRQVLLSLIREGLGPDAADEDVHFTAFSIVNQCRGAVSNNPSMVRLLIGQPLTPAVTERLARHIAAFSTGGMERVRQGHNRE